MASVNIEIKPCGNSYCADDIYVRAGDSIQIKTLVTGQSFNVTVPNEDGYFNNADSVIKGTDDSSQIKILL